MNDGEIAAYVDAACAANDLKLPPDARARVIAQFSRVAGIAAPLLASELAPDVESAATFRP
jgi:hypothetical protein